MSSFGVVYGEVSVRSIFLIGMISLVDLVNVIFIIVGEVIKWLLVCVMGKLKREWIY